MTGGDTAGTDSYAQVGHGGHSTQGNHTGTIGINVAGGITMTETFYLRPRRSLTVEKTD